MSGVACYACVMTNTETRVTWSQIRAAMKSTLPAGVSGDVEIRPIVITERDAQMEVLRGLLLGGARMQRQDAGTITGIYRRGGLWMSDSEDEKSDHIPFVSQCHDHGAETVLIGGLGLGMVVTALCIVPSVREITVIELDADVIALVEPHLRSVVEAAGKSLRIIQGDCMDPRLLLGKDERFDGAWIDVWQHLCTDNLAEMATINRRLSRRCGFVGFWGRELLKAQRARERRQEANWGW
jgi:hypothetical protein